MVEEQRVVVGDHPGGQPTVAEDEDMAIINKKLNSHLRKQELEPELDHGDPQALMAEEQQIVVGDHLEDVNSVVPGYYYN
jgi:hypothetical protein